jgi:hypothetical protein
MVRSDSYLALYDNETTYSQEFEKNLQLAKAEFFKTFTTLTQEQANQLICVCAPGFLISISHFQNKILF